MGFLNEKKILGKWLFKFENLNPDFAWPVTNRCKVFCYLISLKTVFFFP